MGLIKSNHIATRISEAGRNLRRIDPNRLHELSTMSDNGFDGGCNTVAPNVNQQPRSSGWWPPDDPSAADCASSVIECGGSIATLAKLPAEDFRIELRRAADVDSRDLDITDFSVWVCFWHNHIV
jgi:hypothetical protein